MTIAQAALLAGAAIAAGALNAVAGGGSFLTFPALILIGVAPIAANATSTMALWPGSLASATAYRRELALARRPAALLAAASLLGGAAGALLLVRTPTALFVRLLPLLLLLATLTFTFGPRLTARLRARAADRGGAAAPSTALVFAVQLLVAIYGGYFGGGMGFMILATLTLLGLTHIHQMNGLKSLLAVAINGVAVATFVAAGAIRWPPALVMIAGALLGGYGGATLAQRADPARVRRLAGAIGWVITAYFFARAWR